MILKNDRAQKYLMSALGNYGLIQIQINIVCDALVLFCGNREKEEKFSLDYCLLKHYSRKERNKNK